MDTERARSLAQSIIPATGGEADPNFVVFGVILSLNWEDEPMIWVPKIKGSAHWIAGSALGTIAVERDEVEVEFRPIAGPSWRASSTFRTVKSPDPLDNRQWLASKWKFKLAEGDELTVDGEVALNREGSDFNEAEQFARRLLHVMVGDPIRH
jgi:hypothetical protein